MGVAHYQIAGRLYNMGKYEIASFGWFSHTAESRGMKWELPWKQYTTSNHSKPYGHPENYPKDPAWGTSPATKIINEFQPNVVILIADHWMGDYWYDMPERDKFKLIHEFPIDGAPVPSDWVKNIKRADLPIVMTRFAEKAIHDRDPYCTLEVNPRGLDVGVFTPQHFSRPKDLIRKQFMPEAVGRFVVGVFDRYQDRKQIGRAVEGFAKFMKSGRHDNCDLYLHMDFNDSASIQQGKTLVGRDGILKRYNIDGKVLFKKGMTVERGVDVSELAALYNCCDVKLSASQGEGFGLTTTEAMACGVPCVATNYTSFPEFFADGRGLLADVKTTITGMYNVERALVDTEHISELLEKLYRSPQLRLQIGRKAAEWAQTLDWNSNIQNWDNYIQRVLKGTQYRIIEKRRDKKPEQIEKNVNIQGAVYENTGFSIVTRNLALALDRQGVDVSVEPRVPELGKTFNVEPKLSELVNKGKNKVFEIINHMGDEQVKRLAESDALYRIAYFPWELSNIKNSWVDALNRDADAVWCNSKFTADMYKNAGVQEDKIAVIPNGVCLPRLTEEEIKEVKRDERYTFLMVGNLGDIRKNTKTLIQAYMNTFTSDDDVKLVLKSQPGHLNSDPTSNIEFLSRGLKNPPAVDVIHANLSDRELAELFYKSDCYVTTSHAEGFCQPILEACSRGIPVIAPAYGGYLDFATQGMFFGVMSKLEDASESPVYNTNAQWVYVDYGELCKTMKEVFNEKIRPDGVSCVESFTWKNSATKALSEMGKIVERCSSPRLKVFYRNFATNLWNNDNRSNLIRYAPSDVIFVNDINDADLQIVDITRLSDRNNIKHKNYIALFHCFGEWSEEKHEDYLDIFKNAVMVYSHLDLSEFGDKINYTRGPWGVDEDIFYRSSGYGKQFMIVTTGTIAETEGISECVAACDALGGRLMHIGRNLGYKNKSYENAVNLTQTQMQTMYNSSFFVNGMRRVEGFEKPVIEGALCGARPICFDTPLFRHWYKDIPVYVEEAEFNVTASNIVDRLREKYRPITDDEISYLKKKFSWVRVAKNFWEHAMKCEESK